MRLIRDCVYLIFIGSLFIFSAGCNSSEPSVAPRSEDEIAEYKEDVYAAEEADDEAAQE